ncbi:hypothetical protein Dcar01_02633 [Deinococcus carri]|uniref:Uncharacterized protein n=1 Tax=Deinococcus carri TaxID=1211323 RepID=A0ABP9W963_9DEIO
MTKDRHDTPTEPEMGNDMSDRSGYYTESDSGEEDTPTEGGVPLPLGSDLPADVLDADGSGTTFDAGNVIPPTTPDSESD